MILPIQQLQFDFRRIFGITMDYMARYPNQDFQQNVSFKCTMEFRYALKLAMEKARSRAAQNKTVVTVNGLAV